LQGTNFNQTGKQIFNLGPPPPNSVSGFININTQHAVGSFAFGQNPFLSDTGSLPAGFKIKNVSTAGTPLVASPNTTNSLTLSDRTNPNVIIDPSNPDLNLCVNFP